MPLAASAQRCSLQALASTPLLGAKQMQVAPGGLLDRVFREMQVWYWVATLGRLLLRCTCLPTKRCCRWADGWRCSPGIHACCSETLMLQLPASKWKGLKLLPTAAPSASDETFRQMVRPGCLPTHALATGHQPLCWSPRLCMGDMQTATTLLQVTNSLLPLLISSCPAPW